MIAKDRPPSNSDLEGLDADTLLETLVERDPSFAEGSAIYDLVSSLCSSLKRMRTAAGLKQAELAEKLGVSQGRISQIESGLPDHTPSVEMIARFAHACGFTPVVNFDFKLPVPGKATVDAPGLQITFLPTAMATSMAEAGNGDRS
jgi:transcriptional regulator with XRE-family HTH domain